ncbi:MAG: hypothetical protein NT007_14075 [Candidatus Kapabacteria bacterium]|nr:hypothetical protein [Candidatus Kapabacteria bacterium]
MNKKVNNVLSFLHRTMSFLRMQESPIKKGLANGWGFLPSQK